MGYTYADTTAGFSSSASRSAESMFLDGICLEEELPGFRILYTRGREALSPDIRTLSIERRDGDIVTGQRWPSRVITVGYQLVTTSPEAFRAAYNALGGLLKGKHRLIFADESDKFFNGEFTRIDGHEAGTDNVVGEIAFLCADPFKYSVTEYSAPTRLHSVTGADGVTRSLRSFGTNSYGVEYNGTVPAHPRFETRFFDPQNDADEDELPSEAGDCGYIAFLDQNGHVLQFGDPDEADGESHDRAQVLIDKNFTGKDSWTQKASNAWKLNNTAYFDDPVVVQRGAVDDTYSKAVTQAEIDAETATSTLRYLAPTSYGADGDEWHGPSISGRIPVDASGTRGAADWRLYFRLKFCASDSIQVGRFRAFVTSANGTVIAAVEVAKTTNAGTGTLYATFGGKTKGKRIDLSYYNQYFGADKGRKTCVITKTGAAIEFDLGGVQFSMKDSTLANVKAERVSFVWATYGDADLVEPVARNGLYNVRFTKLNCETWTDTPNKFGAGDVLLVDTEGAEILLNGDPSPDLGAFGNDWEGLVLVPGRQHIIESRSKWCAATPETVHQRPVSTMYWREAFL